MKKVLSVVLLLILVLSVTACGNTAGIEDKWVLVSEKEQYSEEFEGSELLHSNEYKYDETGRLIGETLVYHGEGIYVGENYQYDNNGNVVAKTEKYTDYYSQNDSYTRFTYTYDSNNYLVNEIVMYENSETYSITYNYDEQGNLIKENSLYKSSNSVYDGNKIYTLKYENNVCVQSEITFEEIANGDKIIDYSLETYQYDDYGNRIEKKYYTAIESAEEAKNPIEINGKLYKHYSTTTYTYAKLKDVAVEATTNSTTTTTTTKVSLSEIGFNNINEWGCELIEVQPTDNGFVLEDSKGKYVIVQEGTGHWEFYPTQNQFLSSSIYADFIPKRTDVNSFSVLNNDTISVVEPWDSYVLKITDRIEEDNTLILKILNVNRYEYMIPYELVDTTKSPAFYQEGEYFNYYKFYLK